MKNNFFKNISIILLLFVFIYNATTLAAQELYPLSEPASSIPKNVIGVRFTSEQYHEVNQWRTQQGLRIMYGLTPRLSTYVTAIASNHHGNKMPEEFPFHNTPERGAYYPYRFNGAHLYAKYRFLSLDSKNEHFRMAAFAEGTWVKTTHHETEPDLMMGDNSGVGAGLISTYLIQKFAATLTLGFIKPFGISGNSPDPIIGLPDVPVRLEYGNTFTYGLSIGYLVFPRKYQSYNQTNFNIYFEAKGKYFGSAAVTIFEGQANEYFLHVSRYPLALQRGYFLDISPGIQFIIRSNFRIDASVTFPALGKSYARMYPVYTAGLQYYIFK